MNDGLLLRHLADLSTINFFSQKSISFLSNDCSLVHHNLCLSSVFVDGAGEWKLAGVEFMHAHGDPAAPRKHLEMLHKYEPPEFTKARRGEKWQVKKNVHQISCCGYQVVKVCL